MSLTSYRAAPPRGCWFWEGWLRACFVFRVRCRRVSRPGGDLLSHALRRSTIGAEGFHGRVRDGIGCGSLAMTTRSWSPTSRSRLGTGCPDGVDLGVCCLRMLSVRSDPRSGPGLDPGSGVRRRRRVSCPPRGRGQGVIGQADRTISTGQLHVLPRFHLQPIDVVVYHGSQRDLVLRGASRLDAFSGYPVRT